MCRGCDIFSTRRPFNSTQGGSDNSGFKREKFYTKGDNNEVRDPAYVLGEDIIGKVYIGVE